MEVDGKTMEEEVEYPQFVLNTRDMSEMTLITHPGETRPIKFSEGNQDFIVYIDVKEVTNRQFLRFHNQVQDENEGNVPRMLENAYSPIYANNVTSPRYDLRVPACLHREQSQDITKKNADGLDVTEQVKKLVPVVEAGAFSERPVVNVNHFGALAYCKLYGKELPTTLQWRAAAHGKSRAGGRYPWGNTFDQPDKLCANKASAVDPVPNYPHCVGSFASSDQSWIGCLDMAGNVAEWCSDSPPANVSVAKRAVCGGCFSDANPADFNINHVKWFDQGTHYPGVGFRGVVRLYLPPKPKP